MFDLVSSNPTETFIRILLILVVLGFVISLHESAHAWMANRLGDPTARLLGRITLNPAAHIDPIGTILVPIVLLVIGAPVFGWAKPTPINPFNFRQPFRDSALTAFAGPASNFFLAALLGIIFRLSTFLEVSLVSEILLSAVAINIVLGLFNLIPVPPLDGFKVVLGFLPKQTALQLSSLENYGPIVLMLFIFFAFRLFSPILYGLLNIFLGLFTGTAV